MKVQFNPKTNETYTLRYKHLYTERMLNKPIRLEELRLGMFYPIELHPYATCCYITIENSSGKVEEFEGISECSVSDNFARYKGRILAFDRAIQSLTEAQQKFLYELIPSKDKDEYWKVLLEDEKSVLD